MDLYRLSGTQREFAALSLDQVFQNGISLIEWPTRLPEDLFPPKESLLQVDLRILGTAGDDEDAPRSVTIKTTSEQSKWNLIFENILNQDLLGDMIED